MSQFFYIHPDNPQARLLKQAVEIIRQGGVVVYPTDSGYAIGCQVGNKQALEKICRIRALDMDHDFTLVCQDVSELSVYAKVGNTSFRLLKNNTPGPYTFIFKATREVPRRLQNPKRKSIGIRIPNNTITLELLKMLDEPLMSSSLILPGNDFAEADPEEIRDKLEHSVDLIIHGGILQETPTTVIDLYDEQPVVVRAGNGNTEPFE
ncbi:L-threonylcarbamoyladenylate synthase [Gayadomonas joobiniege]|uniref:L-threonylcarbamoyladenylate synthase n=1 Tax=Gayadomonas joobiniege TaxID=1234606 RepID=UPI00037DB627|nr:L-threonylcarbamoyladenylate synthase [Gayadomonas joobiniege]